MFRPRKFLRPALVALVASTIATPAFAQSAAGTIAVALNVTNACIVNGATAASSSLGSLGTIQFAPQPGLFGNVDGELVSGAGALQVQCSPNVSPVLTIGSGANASAGKRRMASAGNTVAYQLFSDSARASEIAIGQQLSLGTMTTSAVTVPIFARVSSAGQILAAGSYTDTVQVTLTW